MRILIDGDGSPVKEDIFQISEAFGIEAILVTTMDHYSPREFPENVQVVYVDKAPDAVDFKLVQLIKKGDILVTQDYGLASIALPKGARVLHQLGYEFTVQNIDAFLANRYLGQVARRQGKRTKGPKPFTKLDHDNFGQKLITMLQDKQLNENVS
ncbi:MAG: YaiI/YqxD family protein [Streptococcaceae bacterium]|jgi:uncharacterized protein YaiI (UPF0178 family)|nr:YaiI/YqxD family protein [Streptococcaceae bacterium]